MDVVRVQLQDVETHAISAIASSTTPGCESSHPTTQDKRKDISKFADVLFRILFSILRLLTSLFLRQHGHKSHLNTIAVFVCFMQLAKVFIIFK